MYKFFNSLCKHEALIVENVHPVLILGIVENFDFSEYKKTRWKSAYIISLESGSVETLFGLYAIAKNSTAVIPLNIINTTTLAQSWVILSEEDIPFQINGPIESDGRLKYIDGAKDSIAIHPPKMGLPCLNVMYFPAGINQHSHTHPSLRCAIVIEGEGSCDVGGESYELRTGGFLIMEENIDHAFYSKTRLVVVTYHPDSENGPTDEAHPMISRTYVDNKPVLQSRPDIQTK